MKSRLLKQIASFALVLFVVTALVLTPAFIFGSFGPDAGVAHAQFSDPAGHLLLAAGACTSGAGLDVLALKARWMKSPSTTARCLLLKSRICIQLTPVITRESEFSKGRMWTFRKETGP